MTTEIKKRNFIAKIIANNRITIPEVQRIVLGIKEGDIIEVEIKKIVKKLEVEATA